MVGAGVGETGVSGREEYVDAEQPRGYRERAEPHAVDVGVVGLVGVAVRVSPEPEQVPRPGAVPDELDLGGAGHREGEQALRPESGQIQLSLRAPGGYSHCRPAWSDAEDM